jgi:hypothetical protein
LVRVHLTFGQNSFKFFQMCRGAVLEYTSLEDFQRRALFPLQRKFARRQHNARASRSLFRRYQHLQVIGIRFGICLYFLKADRYKKGKRVPQYKLVVKRFSRHPTYSIGSENSSSTGSFVGSVLEEVEEGDEVGDELVVAEVDPVVVTEVDPLAEEVGDEVGDELVVAEVDPEVATEVDPLAVEVGDEVGDESPVAQLYDAREIGGIIIREVEARYNQVPIPRFININLQFDTALLEFTDSRTEEVERLDYEVEYGTQPDEAEYDSVGSDGSQFWVAAAPAA